MSTENLAIRHRAWECCVAGRFEEANRLLMGLVSSAGDDVEAWVLLAKLKLQQRDVRGAMAAAGCATRLRPSDAEAWYVLGRAHRANGTLDAAEQCYRRALAAAPDNPDMQTSLGVLLRARGRTEEAIEHYRAALRSDPAHVEAANNLGNALASLGSAAEAQALHDRGRPVLAEQLAAIRTRIDELLKGGNPEDARAAVSDALRIAPRDADLWLNAGKLDCALGRDQSGLACIEEALRLAPDFIEATDVARKICVAAGLEERALRYSDRMLELAPSSDIMFSRDLLLPAIQLSRAAICATREGYAGGLSRALENGDPSAEVAPSPAAADFVIASHAAFYLAYHGDNNRGLQMQLAQWHLQCMPGLQMTAEHCVRGTRRPGRCRVGFISRFFCRHSIAATSRGLIEQLSRERFEVYVLRITPAVDDATTALIRAAAEHTLDLDVGLDAARRQIAALELDVLFYQDIGMEPRSYLLAFARLAPVQCVSFGHPDTTGIPNMDYFVSNDLFEPENAQAHYSEQLFLLHDLPTLAYYYRPATPAQAGLRDKFSFAAADNVYLCPQTLFKLHPDFDALLEGIVARDPRAVVVLIEGSFQAWSESLRARWARSLPALASRIRFIPRLGYGAFLELLAAADVILDTLHFNGMNTSLEAFALGKPVVTLPGALQRGRHTQAMYRKMGILEAIATDAASYVDIAVRLGTDRSYARGLSERILARNAVLFEDTRVIEEFERFFLTAMRA